MIKFVFLFYFIFLNLYAENNYYLSNFDAKNLNILKKKWVYKSNIFKDTQTKPSIFEDKIVYLDGYKNLRVLSLYNGELICVNKGKKTGAFIEVLEFIKRIIRKLCSLRKTWINKISKYF